MSAPSTALEAMPGNAALDALADPARYVLVSCERAKVWLAQALDGNTIEQISEFKSLVEARRIYTMQKQLGKDTVLSATEIVRRAEHCLALAVRKGQACGQIAKRGDVGAGRKLDGGGQGHLKSSSEFFGNKDERTESYVMADATPEQFEAAIAESKAEKNLSRANVARKIKTKTKAKTNGKSDRWEHLAELAADGNTSGQIAKKLGVGEYQVKKIAKDRGIDLRADRVLGKSRRLNHNRVLRDFALTLESLTPSIDLIDVTKVTPSVLAECASVIGTALRALGKFQRLLNHEVSDGQTLKAN